MEFGVSRAGSPGPTHTENPLGTLARRDSTEQKKPEVVVFTEMVHTTKTYLRGCSLVDAAWLQEFQPEYFRTHRIK